MENSGFGNLAADVISEHERLNWHGMEDESGVYEGQKMSDHVMMAATNWSSFMSNSCMPTSFQFLRPTPAPSVAMNQNPSAHHSLAERNRREKISRSFMALSALLPGRKKMDKASILGDAIEYMKELEAKVRRLEEKAGKNSRISNLECVRFSIGEDGDGEKSSSSSSSCSSVMEARYGDSEVLVSIHCQKRKGVLEKVVGELEKHHLSVVNTSLLTYGDSYLNITVIAQKKEESAHLCMEQLVRNLQGFLQTIL